MIPLVGGIFSGISRLLHPCVPALLHTRLASLPSALDVKSNPNMLTPLSPEPLTEALSDIGYDTTHRSSPCTCSSSGATVDERLDSSPPTKANRVQSPAGSLPDFSKWGSCLTMPLVGGFSRGSPVPPPLYYGAVSFSPRFTLIGSQDLLVLRRSYVQGAELACSVSAVLRVPARLSDDLIILLFECLKQYSVQILRRAFESTNCFACFRLVHYEAVSLLASRQGDPGSIRGRFTPDFRMSESCRTTPLVGGFSWGSPVSPAFSFRRCSIITSIIPIGSQDLDVKSRPNLFTQYIMRYKGVERLIL
ncbi:hypothetical protein PR048_030551, partial [Dryococelus australis]